jgi:CHASE2 domain-containing sensor protein
LDTTDESKTKKAMPVVRVLIYFSLACIIAFLLEHSVEHLLGENRESHSSLAQSIFGISGIYQQLVTAGPRKPVQKFTVLVDDDPTNDPYYSGLSQNVLGRCARRNSLAILIDRIASADPAVIVVDKAFREDECPQNDLGTKHLQEVVGALSTKIPLIVGRRIIRSERRLYHSLAFPDNGAGSFLGEGIIEIDPDTRKLPLKWAVHPNEWYESKGPTWEWVKTLSLKAAEAFDVHLHNKYPRLKELLPDPPSLVQEPTHPYISFVKREQLTIYKAGEILCGHNYSISPTVATTVQCEKNPEVLRDLRGKIVLVGETNEADMHLSILGEIPGFILQANYIEALLDQRYFNPAPWLDYMLGFLIFASILLGPYIFDHNFLKTFIWWLVTLCIAYLLIYVIIMNFGYYVNPVEISVLALVINLSHLLFSWLNHTVRGKQ